MKAACIIARGGGRSSRQRLRTDQIKPEQRIGDYGYRNEERRPRYRY